MFAGGPSSDAWLVRCRPAVARERGSLDELLGRVGRLGRVHAEPDHLVAPVAR